MPAERAKAIEIANALLAEGYAEGRAIRIAIAQARQWAQRPYRARGHAHTRHLILVLIGALILLAIATVAVAHIVR